MTLIIKNFKKHYEKSDHTKVKVMKWIAVPVKFQGLKYRRIMRMKNGPEILGAWIVLLQLASQMEERGVFKEDGKDLSIEDIQVMTDFPAKTMEIALKTLSSENIGWITETSGKFPENSAEFPTTGQDITEQNNTEQNKTIYESKFEIFWNSYPKRNGKRVGKKATQELWFKQKLEDLDAIIVNAKNYGINNSYAKDPERFLKKEFWKDWDSPQTGSNYEPMFPRVDLKTGKYL